MAIAGWTLFGISVLAIVVIFAAEILYDRGVRLNTLPPTMLLVLRIALGVVFTILGVIGSVLPIMQGWIFFLLAVLVLFPKSNFAIKSCQKIQGRMPRLVARLHKWGIGVHPEHKGDDPAQA